MIVDRRTFYIRPAHFAEAVQMTVAENKRVGVTNVRFYTSRTGRFNTFAVE